MGGQGSDDKGRISRESLRMAIEQEGTQQPTTDCLALSRIRGQRIVLLAATQAFALECVNSAVEKTCDRIGSEKNELVKISKDAASAAVLLSVIVSLALDTMIVVARLIGCM